MEEQDRRAAAPSPRDIVKAPFAENDVVAGRCGRLLDRDAAMLSQGRQMGQVIHRFHRVALYLDYPK
jgi:hypothetical protein